MQKCSSLIAALTLSGLVACGSKPAESSGDTSPQLDTAGAEDTGDGSDTDTAADTVVDTATDTDTHEDTDSDEDEDEDTDSNNPTVSRYEVGFKPTTEDSIWNGELIGNVFLVETPGTLESFSFHHETDHKGGCRLDFLVLAREMSPSAGTASEWTVEREFNSIIVGKDSTNSGALGVVLKQNAFYATAVHADDCTGREGLGHPVQANRDGPTDVGVGDTIGYLHGEKKTETNGLISGISFEDNYTSPFMTTLHISGL